MPSDFGFALVVDHNDSNTAYIIPLESDEFRCTPEAKLRVYRTRNAGETWEPLTNGLPQENAFETVLRDGMAGDTLESAGLYFGTRNGKLFGTNDGGRVVERDHGRLAGCGLCQDCRGLRVLSKKSQHIREFTRDVIPKGE